MSAFGRCFALWLCLCACLLADEIALVRVGEEWRYYPATNEPPFAPSDWRQLGFDDSNWPQGKSGFGTSAYNATSLNNLWPGYTTFYFRKQFLVADPAAVQWLVLRADYQDGFVAYLNGKEICRRGLPGEPDLPVPFDALATPHPAGIAEEIPVTSFARLLVPGQNILAIQVHRWLRESYGLELTPELLANFTRGPYIQDASTNHVRILWKTPVPADSLVEFGANLTNTWILADTNSVVTHSLLLTDLTPDTPYYYRVRSSSDQGTVHSPWFNFRTLTISGSVSFVVVGDTGYGTQSQYRIAKVMQDAAPELVMVVGDIIYPSFTAARADLRCFSVYQPQMRTTPFFFALGNHDRYDNPVDFLATFCLPTNSLTGTSHFYSFDHGDAHFVVLDTDVGQRNDWSVGSPQCRWLETDLAGTTKPWKFLFFHNAIRSSGPHRFDDYNLNSIPDRSEFQASIGEVAARYGVQVIFNAHEHLYERLRPVGGVHTIVTGGGGAVLYYLGGEWDAASAFFWSRYNCVKVEIHGDGLELQALSDEGEVFDRMYLQRAAPPRQRYQATWNTPVFNTPPDNASSDSNRTEFGFAGAPIAAKCGQFSNLGRCYVNNGSNALYLGFEHFMLYNSNNLFLFIETPRLPGVSNLLAVGNGLVDPEGQGADGLDFLANLSFTNFAPAIGCILGDDNGNGQFRSFARTNLELNIGQGVFWLNSDLPDVEDVRLQQFSLAPAGCRAPDDHNAEFIQVAIPLTALGGLQPGDTIKLGAVVAGNRCDTNFFKQTRQLDTGFLGYSLAGSGQAPVLLEGLEVQLARPESVGPDPPPRMQIQVLSTNQVRLSWSAVVGRQYQLESMDNERPAFLPVPDPFFPRTAANPIEVYTVPLLQDGNPLQFRFYRLRVAP